MPLPDPQTRHPIAGWKGTAFLKAVVDHPLIEVGDYSYYDDSRGPEHFVARCVRYHLDFIGDRLIIGTRAQVTKDVPAYAVVAGNPGRVVKMRFAPGIVTELLAIRWWDWEADRIARHIDAIQGADIDALRAAV